MGELDARLAGLTADDLRPVVRAALRDPDAQVLEWTVELPGWISANPITRGVARLRGTAVTGAGLATDWTVVLKIIGTTEFPFTQEPQDANYWRREADALGSGLIDQRPAPLVAVDLLLLAAPSPDEVCLWLECLDSNDLKAGWDIEDQLAAGYDLGAFNAIWSRDPPRPEAYPWLAQRWLRGWIEYGWGFGVGYSLAHAECWRHPLIAPVLPEDTYARFARLMDDSEDLLRLLEVLPVTLTHHDAQWRNLFIRSDPARSARSQGRTVAVDWSFLGLAPVGADLGHLIGCDLELGTIKSDEAAEVDAALTTAYLEGLAAHGWRGDEQVVRFAIALSASLQLTQVFAAAVAWLHGQPAELGQEDLARWPEVRAAERGVSVDDAIAGWAAVFHYLLDLGDEARELAEVIARRS